MICKRVKRKLLVLAFSVLTSLAAAQELKTDVLVVGGGASGTMAGIQSARMGVQTTIIEESDWLGGMLTAAGVSAIDGNHNLPSGLWGEFRQKLYDYYGGAKAVETGWVSNTLFEPSVGDQILKNLSRVEGLSILFRTTYHGAVKTGEGWRVSISQGKKKRQVICKILIDATELGDVAASLKVPYRIGMDAARESGESFAPNAANNIIQDLTYVLILKDYGKGVDKTIGKPAGYRRDEFLCACEGSKTDEGGPSPNCQQMMRYGKLPNGKYMINWPRCGNDFYLNLVEKKPAERDELLKEAKLHSLRFLYYLQTELGFSSYGLAVDEFPTKDDLPLIPYHRESRRIKGMAELNVNHVASPFTQASPLYRTGIAVGDYPIDHHHDKNEDAPKIDFINIKVPAYNVPIGSLIPVNTPGLIVAEKSISVTNIVNGATRLQPVVMLLGQASGALAAVCVKDGTTPDKVNIRKVQEELLRSKAYLMPYRDVSSSDPAFAAINRIGATGILRGTGIPYKWANQTWFYPSYALSEWELVNGLATYFPAVSSYHGSGAPLTAGAFLEIVKAIQPDYSEESLKRDWKRCGISISYEKSTALSRGNAALLIDQVLNPFSVPVDFNGKLVNSGHQ